MSKHYLNLSAHKRRQYIIYHNYLIVVITIIINKANHQPEGGGENMEQKDKLGTLKLPYDDCITFEAKIKDGKAGLGEIVDELVTRIQSTPKLHYGHKMNWDSRIPYNNKEIDKKNKVAAFILLKEEPYIVIMGGRGMEWFEAIYGLRIDGDKLKGRIIDFGYGSHGSDGDRGNHYRFILDGIEDGVLKYTQKWRNGLGKIEPLKRKFDLKEID